MELGVPVALLEGVICAVCEMVAVGEHEAKPQLLDQPPPLELDVPVALLVTVGVGVTVLAALAMGVAEHDTGPG